MTSTLKACRFLYRHPNKYFKATSQFLIMIGGHQFGLQVWVWNARFVKTVKTLKLSIGRTCSVAQQKQYQPYSKYNASTKDKLCK